jgi:hypothetical protein
MKIFYDKYEYEYVLGYQLVFNNAYVYPSIVCDCHEKDITLMWQKCDEISPNKFFLERIGGFFKPRNYDIISLLFVEMNFFSNLSNENIVTYNIK